MLEDLFILHQSDKGWHGYPPIYESYFDPVREQPITILELGVLNGGSLKAWQDYFPNATIVGFDNLFDSYLGERIHTHRGLQENTEHLEIVASHCGPFDIIIDDCGHMWKPQQISFEYLWPHVKKGGLYIIEDLLTSYMEQEYGSPDWERTTDYLKKFIDVVVNSNYKGPFEDIKSMHLHMHLAILEKKR